MSGILVPDDVSAGMACDQQVEVFVSIHVAGADVVGPLINANEMPGELSIPRVLVPDRYAIDIATASGDISVAIANT